MNGDITRSTFDARRHFSGVRMQQGRVQLDADWNEQEDIVRHRVETETVDVVGTCGAPYHDAGFALTPVGTTMRIEPGRYYVNGVMCENDDAVLLAQQPDAPAMDAPVAGTYVAYLDVWTRHLTALDAPLLRERALGGPDTATRTRTVWQVRLLSVPALAVPGLSCATPLAAWTALTAPPTARLRARATQQAAPANVCIVAAGGGYRRLENQLYRVEIHGSGGVGGGGAATFKWSRDNGSVVGRWVDKQGDDLILESAPRDSYLRFSSGDWVELLYDDNALNGTPGTLVKVKVANANIVTIDPATAIPAGAITYQPVRGTPIVRRWESAGALVVQVAAANQGYLALEDGVEVRFEAGATYQTGQYWQIPARVANADVEWPQAAGLPIAMPPAGIAHDYCRLGIATFTGAAWTVADCRTIFPPATELVELFHVGGAGQEVMPNPATPFAPVPLPQPLQVGVSNGSHPVAGARVRFTVVTGGGLVAGAPSTIVPTGANGVASCIWSVGTGQSSQQAQAELLDALGIPMHLPVVFNANLSTAASVAYSAGACATLAGATTVQAALDTLCALPRGGSCCVTVGKGGEFATLEVAIATLLDKTNDICLCLLPGDHQIDKDLDIAGDGKGKHVRIHGSGAATRVHLVNGVVKATRLASLTLEAFELTVEAPIDRPISIEECDDVRVIDCVVVQAEAPTTLLHIAKGKTVEVRGSHLRSSILERVTRPLADAFGMPASRLLDSAVDRVLANIIVADPSALKILAGSLQPAYGRNKFALDALNARMGFVSAAAAGAKKDELQLGGLLDALQSLLYPCALAIEGVTESVRIADCRVDGELRLYGDTGPLSVEDYRNLARQIEGFPPTDSTARLTGNRLTRVVVDGAIVKSMQGGVPMNAMGRLFLTDNVITAPFSQWLAGVVHASGNEFAQRGNALLATSASGFLTLVGNVCAPAPGGILARTKSAAAALSANVQIAFTAI